MIQHKGSSAAEIRHTFCFDGGWRCAEREEDTEQGLFGTSGEQTKKNQNNSQQIRVSVTKKEKVKGEKRKKKK
ncbi:hypothetical protein, partial [Escherichia coli]|uniref:hypothetical protein n=1 Tax=Escherichia coli TaxID=562 RepID=UPI00148508EF